MRGLLRSTPCTLTRGSTATTTVVICRAASASSSLHQQQPLVLEPHLVRRVHKGTAEEGQQAASSSPPWHQLFHAARIARWSGLCYLQPKELEEAVKAEPCLTMVAHGRTSFTSWFVADGEVDYHTAVQQYERYERRRQKQVQPSPLGFLNGLPLAAQLGAADSASSSMNVAAAGVLSSLAGAANDSRPAWNGPAPSKATPTTSLSPSAMASGPATGSISATASTAPNSVSLPDLQHDTPSPTSEPADMQSSSTGKTHVHFGGEPGQAQLQSRPQAGAQQLRQRQVPGHAQHGAQLSARIQPKTEQPGLQPGRAQAQTSLLDNQQEQQDLQIQRRRQQDLQPVNETLSQSAISTPSSASDLVSQQEGQGDALAAAVAALPLPASRKTRYVFLRGVQWGAPDVDAAAIWRSLANFWPTVLAGHLTWPPKSLVAHGGVAALAAELYPMLQPYIRGVSTEVPLVFAGHSLGGSLAKLLWSLSLLNKHRSPSNTSCLAFGSPAVLAHAEGGGGDRALEVLRAPADSCSSYVLEYDPIPRTLLSSDMTFVFLRRLGGDPFERLLQLRGWLLGRGSPLSPERFVFESVGELLLLRWSAATGGAEAERLSPDDIDKVLRISVDDIWQRPAKTFQLWMDHHHASYTRDLETAALSALRRRVNAQSTEQ